MACRLVAATCRNIVDWINFSEKILIKMQNLSFMKMYVKMSSGKMSAILSVPQYDSNKLNDSTCLLNSLKNA